ncbi:uncharacterized protein At3g49140-like isoform X1 [Musa acuminata AAA Group]|uniref:uncharacterized protein At3g49140-like isoform X1 n=1 Tax=Musa acuminata AAA Group TaxID=214697 RepID=UPI0031D741D9
MAIGLVYPASSHGQLCDREGLSCSLSAGTAASWIKSTLDGRRVSEYFSFSSRWRSPYFGSKQSYWLQTAQELSVKVRVAADYSDSVPDSSKYHKDLGYHPLEELKEREKNKNIVLTNAELARTTVEANNKALLIFPGGVHNEPHRHVSWAEFQYVIDDYGDMFFELFDDENILQDHGADSPVMVLIGSDWPTYEEISTISDNFDMDGENDIGVSELNEIDDTEVMDTLINWGMPDTLRYIHPLYFAKCLIKVVQTKFGKVVDWPSNGLQIIGCLRPAFIDEESYLRRLFHRDDGDNYISDWRDESEKEEEQVARAYDLIDGGMLSFDSKRDVSTISSTLYKLEIITVELHSVYGDQSLISLQEFQDAEPDLLAHSASAIIERINEYGLQCNVALKALCRRKKGLNVEGANLIGIDSLGIDVRVYCGMEARTLRFPFSARVSIAMSESAAEKKIKRMLFPRYHRKNLRTATDGIREL